MKFMKKIIAGALFALVINNAQAQIVEGQDYTVLSKPIPVINNKKVEVLEFFAYSCVHCYHLEKDLSKEVKKFPPDVYFRQEHVVWDEQMAVLAKISAAANISGTNMQATPAVFHLLFEERDKANLVLNPSAFKQWANEQGAWGKKLAKAYDNQATVAAAEKMAQYTMNYGINSTPQLIVGGKYRLNNPTDFSALRELIDKVRSENGIKPAKPVAQQRLGAMIAAQANR